MPRLPHIARYRHDSRPETLPVPGLTPGKTRSCRIYTWEETIFFPSGSLHIDPAFPSSRLSISEPFFRKDFGSPIEQSRSGEWVITTIFLHFSSSRRKKHCLWIPFPLRIEL